MTPTVDADVLAALARADQGFTPAELQRLIGSHSVSGVRKSLLRLVQQGIITAERAGRAHVYRFNRAHLAADAITELANLKSTLLDRLREELRGWQIAPVFAAVFGSAARGEMRLGSDIDLFLVRPSGIDEQGERSWDGAVADLAARATSWTGNDVRALEMSEQEVADGLDAGERVLSDIRRDGLVVAGDRRFWRKATRG